jgi:uracil-DNA glycosylase
MQDNSPTINLVINSVDQSWNIERIAREQTPPSWEQVFEDASAEIEHVSKFIEEKEKGGATVYPLKRDIFRAFYVTRLEDVKVVIMGQDPYPHLYCGKPGAVGMSFSVRRGDKVPPSLQNIYKEIESSVEGFVTPNHGDLTNWARQGVLLLNACLTLENGGRGSHSGIWSGFIDVVVKAIVRKRPNTIFVLWGRDAQALAPSLGGRAIILTAAHPSPLSANRGFFGCGHFPEINKRLREMGDKEIDFNL